MSYKNFEAQYFDLLRKIRNEGVVCVSERQSNDQQITRTQRIWGYTFNIDLQQEFPLLTAKHVAAKSACQEILWIMQKQSNNIHDLKPHIWDKWADDEGSIGKTYGYNIAKPTRTKWYVFPSQVHYLLGLLEKDPSSRHGVLDMWDCTTLNEQNCVPCCYTSHWAILDGKLNVAVFQRSADSCIGLPFNIAQYAFLAKAFARHLGVEVGTYIHNITDAHIYENQFGNFDTGEMNESFAKLMENYETFKGECNPQVEFDESSTSFWNITDNNFKITGYEIGENCCEDISFEVTA